MAEDEEFDRWKTQKPYGEIPYDPKVRDFDHSSVERRQEEQKILDELRNRKPSWQTDGFGIRGRQADLGPTINEPRRTDAPIGTINRRQDVPSFLTAVTEATTVTQEDNIEINFLLRNASTTEDDVTTYKVLILDGKINGQFPAGMGGDDYVLTVGDPNDSIIYAGATFNPTTLEITSRFLDVTSAGSYPESRVDSDTEGFLYWQLGFTFLDDDVFHVRMARIGNINFALSYGSVSGTEALLPVDSEIGFLSLGFLP